jgi:beta-lactamase regulating signal transducer with metallopeptidase domain
MILSQAVLQTPTVAALTSGLSSLGQIGLALLLQTTLLLVFGFVVTAFLRHQRPAIVSLIYRSLLVGVLLTSLLSIALQGRIQPLWSISQGALNDSPQSTSRIVSAASAAPGETMTSSGDVSASVSSPSQFQQPPIDTTATSPASPNTSVGLSAQDNTESLVKAAQVPVNTTATELYGFFAAAWLIGAAVHLVWLSLAFLHIARLRRTSCIIHDERAVTLLRQLSVHMGVRPPLLLSHTHVQAPFLCGLLRPAIVLPADYDTMYDEAAMRAVLLHELAHVAQRDCWWKLLARASCAIFWVQPLLWLLSRRLEQVNESLCDEAVLNGGCAPRSYAGVLLDLAERVSSRSLGQAAGAGMVSFRSDVGRRIQRIMESPRYSTRPVSRTTRLGVVAAITGAATSVLVLIAVEAAPQRPAMRESSAQPSTTASAARQSKFLQRQERPLPAGLPQSLEQAAAQGNATISGRVLDENGKPVAGVGVMATSPISGRTRLWGYERNASNKWKWPKKIANLISGQTVTRADGTYRISGLIEQHYNVYVLGNRFFANRAPVGWIAPERGVGVMAQARRSAKAPDIILKRAALIKVRVVDSVTGFPLQGVTLQGFTLDESSAANAPVSRSVDAHQRMRPMKGFGYAGATDKNGYCTLSLDPGKVSFFISGGMRMVSIRPNDRKSVSSPPAMWPMLIITTNGLYKNEEWCEVQVGKQAPRRAWKGETEVQVKKGQVLPVTLRLKKYTALTPVHKAVLKRHRIEQSKSASDRNRL